MSIVLWLIYQDVQCDCTYVGCQESFLREETENHMEASTHKHLALVSSVTAKLGQEFECRMYGQDVRRVSWHQQQDNKDFEKEINQKAVGATYTTVQAKRTE